MRMLQRLHRPLHHRLHQALRDSFAGRCPPSCVEFTDCRRRNDQTLNFILTEAAEILSVDRSRALDAGERGRGLGMAVRATDRDHPTGSRCDREPARRHRRCRASRMTSDPIPRPQPTRLTTADNCTDHRRNVRHRLAASPLGKQRNHRRPHRGSAERRCGGSARTSVARHLAHCVVRMVANTSEHFSPHERAAPINVVRRALTQ